MTIIGNLILAFAVLDFYLIFSALFLKAQPRGGDAVMSYAWGMIIFYLVLLGLLAILSLIIGHKGGFDWVSPHKATRVLLVGAGLLAALTTAALSALFQSEPGPMAMTIRLFSGFAPTFVPVVCIVVGAILLNDNFRETVPVALYKIPLQLVFWVGMLGSAALLLGWIVASFQNVQRHVEDNRAFYDQNQRQMMDEIDACDVHKDMVPILVLSDANQTPELREKAVKKIKTNPQWQQELIRLLQTDWAPEAFNFLASNEVDDKTLFVEPVRQGALIQAKLIRESIQGSTHPSHFYPDRFSWEVERVLRTVDKFDGLGVDYVPAVRALRTALDEPAEVEKTPMKATELLDRWLKNHR